MCKDFSPEESTEATDDPYQVRSQQEVSNTDAKVEFHAHDMVSKEENSCSIKVEVGAVVTQAKEDETPPHELMEEIGLSFAGLHCRNAVQAFYERYTRSNVKDYYFNYEHRYEAGAFAGIVAELVTPSVLGRVFRGDLQPTQKDAEVSACTAFTRDLEILDIAQKLPPSGVKIANYLKAKRGWAERSQADEIFLQFQSVGCRTACWDRDSNL